MSPAPILQFENDSAYYTLGTIIYNYCIHIDNSKLNLLSSPPTLSEQEFIYLNSGCLHCNDSWIAKNMPQN